MRRSKETIEDMTGCEVKDFSVPYGFYDRRLIHLVQEAGYRSLFTEDCG
jgi:peptidoglycan/xylan/chitin deacetylase (PgdA/CDA1 family)